MFHMHQSLPQYQCTGRISDFYVTLFRDERKSFLGCRSSHTGSWSHITHAVYIVFCDESVFFIQNIWKRFFLPCFPFWKFRTKRWGWANFLKIYCWGRNIHLWFMNRFRELICETKLKLSEHSVFRNGKYPFESDKSFYRSKKIFYNLTQIQLLCSYFFYFFDQLILIEKWEFFFAMSFFNLYFLNKREIKLFPMGN